jgi:WD40 repeat protein
MLATATRLVGLVGLTLVLSWPAWSAPVPKPLPESSFQLADAAPRVLDGPSMSVAFSPDGKLLASAYTNDSVWLWDVESGRRLKQFKDVKVTGWVHTLAFSADGKRLAVGAGGNGVGPEPIVLLDVASGETLRRFGNPQASYYALALSADGKYLAATGLAFQVWDATTGELKHTIEGGRNGAGQGASVALSPDGKLLACRDRSHLIRLIDVQTGKEIIQFGRRDGEPDFTMWVHMAFAPDGKTLVVRGGDRVVERWDVATGKVAARFAPGDRAEPANRGSSSFAGFSPDGKVVFGGGLGKAKDTVTFWDAVTGKELFRLPADDASGFHGAALAPDGRLLATSNNYRLQLWRCVPDRASGAPATEGRTDGLRDVSGEKKDRP